MSQGAAGPALAGLHGFARALTSFVGRASQLDEVAGLLGEYRLVTLTGPGGVDKTLPSYAEPARGWRHAAKRDPRAGLCVRCATRPRGWNAAS